MSDLGFARHALDQVFDAIDFAHADQSLVTISAIVDAARAAAHSVEPLGECVDCGAELPTRDVFWTHECPSPEPTPGLPWVRDDESDDERHVYRESPDSEHHVVLYATRAEAERMIAALAASPAPEPTPGLRERIDGLLVAFYESLSHDPDDGKLRRCIACGRTSAIVAYDASLADAPVAHKPDCVVAQVLALAASPAPEPTGLDAAWAEAEAALPDGAYLWLHRVASGAYYVSAFRNDQPIVARLSTVSADGDTPAAALRALAARLTDKEPGT